MLTLAVLGDAATLAWCMHAAAAAAGATIVISADTQSQLSQAGELTQPVVSSPTPSNPNPVPVPNPNPKPTPNFDPNSTLTLTTSLPLTLTLTLP